MKTKLIKAVFLLMTCSVMADKHHEEHHHEDEHKAHKHEKHHHDGEHGAHIHGVSKMTIVMDQKNLSIELTSPAMDIVGFEHGAESKEDKSALKEAKRKLRQHNKVFPSLTKYCSHKSISFDDSALTSHKEHHHDEHDGEEKHSKHHDFVANYQYECKNKSSLSGITVSLFTLFPEMKEIDVQWIIHRRQGAKEITPEHNRVKFK